MARLALLTCLSVKNVLMRIKLKKESSISKKELTAIEKDKEVSPIMNLPFCSIDLLWPIIKKEIMK